MTSINTNYSALAALQTLRSTNSRLQTEQDQVSSGLRIGKAADNAAYWSIATTMRSDNKALSAVSDALGLGAATVDTAYAGMSSVIDVLSQVKAKLVAATEDGVDKNKVQGDIQQLKEQVKAIADSASFSGQNWLSTGTSGGTSATVVSSFVRNASGGVSVKTTDVDLTQIALFTASGGGLLQGGSSSVGGGSNIPAGGLGGLENISNLSAHGNWPGFTFTPFTLATTGSIAFDLKVNSTTYNISIDYNDVHGVTGSGTVPDSLKMMFVLCAVIYPQTTGVTVNSSGSTVWIDGVSSPTNNTVSISNVTYTDSASASSGSSSSSGGLMAIDITSGGSIGGYLSSVEGMLKSTTAAASTLGSLRSRIDLQADFTGKLSDSITSGVGRLVDADMEEASSRLSALQTQQQLAVQSLSIANSAPSNILSLFR